MKALRKARVTWVTDQYLPDPNYHDSFLADVFVNGNNAVMNAFDKASGDMVRVDRLLSVTVQIRKDPDGPKGAEILEISGRSEYLKDMGLAEDEQLTTIRVKGGKCETCK